MDGGGRIYRLAREEEAATVVEYAVLVALIILVCVAAVTNIGSKASNAYNTLAESVPPVEG
jgi:pilus assembly protein Flp/PilA